MPDLMRLCLELKTEIFNYLFVDSNEQAVHILSTRVPAHTAIRAVNQHLYNETTYAYQRAEKHIAKKRQTIINNMIKAYETITPFVPTIIIPNICLLATQPQHPPSTYTHPCAKHNCYMCSNRTHRRCFECGKNLALAPHFRTPPSARPPPPPNRPNPLSHPLTPRTQRHHNQSPPQPLGRTISDFETHPPSLDIFGRKPSAFIWWRIEYLSQQARDPRCCIRRFAVRRYWSEARWRRFGRVDEGIGKGGVGVEG